MFCMKCGAQLKDDARFCAKCGAPVKAPELVAVETGQPTGRSPKKVAVIVAVAVIVIAAMIAAALAFVIPNLSSGAQGSSSTGMAASSSSSAEAAKPAAAQGQSSPSVSSGTTSASAPGASSTPSATSARTAAETPPDEAGLLSDSAAFAKYNLFLSNFSETGMKAYGQSGSNADALVRFALLHDGINSRNYWESNPSGTKTNREAISRIDELAARYFGASVAYSDITAQSGFVVSEGYVLFNAADLQTSPQGVACVTGSRKLDDGTVRVYFDVYSGSYDATNQDLYSLIAEELMRELGADGPAGSGEAVVSSGSGYEQTGGLTLVSYSYGA